MSFEQSVANRALDVFSQTPESMHMVMLVARHPGELPPHAGLGVNTYRWVSDEGESVLVTYHRTPEQGVEVLHGGRRREGAGRVPDERVAVADDMAMS